MNLKKALESANSKNSAEAIVRWVGGNRARFDKLVGLLLEDENRIQVRAAWPLSYCVENHPNLVQPHLRRLVRYLRQPGIDGAVKRSIVRLLQFVDVPKGLQGQVADSCFAFVADPHEAPAVRAFSMTVADNLTRSNPDLRPELCLILEDQLPYATPAFTSRARKILGIKKNCRVE